VERKNYLLTGRNLHQNQNQNQEGWPSARKEGDNKHCNTIQRIPAGTEKHKLMTTMMSYVQSKESRGRRGASWELPQQSGPIAA